MTNAPESSFPRRRTAIAPCQRKTVGRKWLPLMERGLKLIVIDVTVPCGILLCKVTELFNWSFVSKLPGVALNVCQLIFGLRCSLFPSSHLSFSEKQNFPSSPLNFSSSPFATFRCLLCSSADGVRLFLAVEHLLGLRPSPNPNKIGTFHLQPFCLSQRYVCYRCGGFFGQPQIPVCTFWWTKRWLQRILKNNSPGSTVQCNFRSRYIKVVLYVQNKGFG